MKKIILTLALMIGVSMAATAQNYMVVDSEQIFKSIAEYNNAISSVDKLGEEYQKAVDAKFAEVENLYQTYMARRNSLAASSRQSYENSILKLEKEAEEMQQKYFAEDGELFKRRVELIAPIQQRVFSAIENFATANNFDMVIDLASNATLLYTSPKVNKTEDIIKQLNK